MTKSIALATLLILLLAGIVFQYYITALPELDQPISVQSATRSTETGTISVTFQDRDGDQFHFGVRGSADSEPQAFPLFYIRNPKLVPYVYWPSVGGPDERALLRVLDGWIQRNVSPEAQARLAQASPEALSPSEADEAAVYQIYEILQARHRR